MSEESLSGFFGLKRNYDKVIKPTITAPHKNEKIYYVDRFHRVKETQTIMEFKTGCYLLPSSWRVIIDITKLNILEKFLISITMMRADTGKIPIHGIVTVWLMNVTGKTCPHAYEISKNIPYSVKPLKNEFTVISQSVYETFIVNDHFRCLLNTDQNGANHVTLSKDMLILKVQLFVRGCCDYEKINNVERNRSSEKMTLKKKFLGVQNKVKMHSEEESSKTISKMEDSKIYLEKKNTKINSEHSYKNNSEAEAAKNNCKGKSNKMHNGHEINIVHSNLQSKL